MLYYRCAIWIDNCGLLELKNYDTSVLNKKYRLCSLHFESNMFRNSQQNRLKIDAIPTLFESTADCLNNDDVAAYDTSNE